jgi:hypothetical protein
MTTQKETTVIDLNLLIINYQRIMGEMLGEVHEQLQPDVDALAAHLRSAFDDFADQNDLAPQGLGAFIAMEAVMKLCLELAETILNASDPEDEL